MKKNPGLKFLLPMVLLWPFFAAAQGDSRIDLAREWEKNGEFDRAAQELRLHLSDHPEDVASWEWMGDIRMRAGKFKKAAESYQSGLQHDPGNTGLQEKLSLALKKLEDNEMPPMAHEISEASPAAPEPPKPAISEPVPVEMPKPIATSLETPKAAVKNSEVFAKPIKTSVQDKVPVKPVSIYDMPEYLKALEQYRTGKKEEASQTLRAVLARSPQHPGAYYLGGVIRYEQGDFEKAEYNFKLGFTFPEKGFNGHYYLGKIRQKQGKIPEAIIEYETYRRLTQSEAGRKQADAALSELREKRPKKLEADTGAVVSQPENGIQAESPAADTSAKKDTLSMHPGTKEAGLAEYLTGNALSKGGEMDSAVNAYQSVMDHFPESYWAKQAQWRKIDAVWRKEHPGVLD